MKKIHGIIWKNLILHCGAKTGDQNKEQVVSVLAQKWEV